MFETIISLQNLFDAWTEFKKGKANREDVAEFEFNLENNIFNLHEDLKSGHYTHGGYTSFIVHDPKRRLIHKASVRDRLLHHAVHRVIEPIWDTLFIFDSWSSRSGKGTHAAVERLQQLALRLSHNYTRTFWVLQVDIVKFFASIDHKIFLGMLLRKTHDKRLLGLLREIVESLHPGLPLGNLTSQLFANIYMHELDMFVKHKLKVRGYIRYADDFVLMCSDKKFLIYCVRQIATFLRERLHLTIHKKKILLKTYASGIDFLGYICFPHYSILRTKTKQRMFKRANEKNVASYLGILTHCRSRALQARLMQAVYAKRYTKCQS